MKNKSRYKEVDFNDFLKCLMDEQKVDESKESGIIRLVIDKGFNSLTDKQKFVFERAIRPYVFDECLKCGNDIPWSEMLAAEDNSTLCSWCQHVAS